MYRLFCNLFLPFSENSFHTQNKYTYTFTSGNAQMTTIRVNVVDKAASLWLDDFSLSGSVIENSGFEEEASDKE